MNETLTAPPSPTPTRPDSVTSRLVWRDGLSFDAEVDGFHLDLDAEASVGGHGLGPRPKPLVLTAVAGCTAMDVIAILRKMRVQLEGFEVSADGVMTEKHPRVFSRIELRYHFHGDDLPVQKLERAVTLSQDKYCGVSAMLRPTVQLARSIYVNDVLVSRFEEPVPAHHGETS